MTNNNWPRRAQMNDWTPAERAIYDAAQVVEVMPADERLTEAVVLLSKARDLVADFVDGVPKKSLSPTPGAPHG